MHGVEVTLLREWLTRLPEVHAQGIIHRDIKPDNCLVTGDDVLKITDFGVSEMFEKESEMHTTKSAGSPAFMPPELCVAKHGQISGKAADVWSMGVTLFCLHFGKIPFEVSGMLELYDAIRCNPIHELDPEKIVDDDLCDLLVKLLEKDPQKRIDMDEIRVGNTESTLWNASNAFVQGSPVGYEERNRSTSIKGGEHSQHHRSADRGRNQRRHHRKHGTSSHGGKLIKHDVM